MSKERRIKFLSRDLPFPTDPTFREYKIVEELTGVGATQIMTGTAGIWMLPVLAIVAMIRANPNVTIEQLDRILDLNPAEIEVTGTTSDEDEKAPLDSPIDTVDPSTGTPSTPETQEQSGTPDSPTTSPEQPADPTT